MTDLMNTLYSFVTTHKVNGLWDDPEYRSATACVQRQEDKLRALLDEAGRQVLDDLLNEQLNQHCMELEQLFQGTIALCRELGRALG